jgi:hypothetical protein
MSDERYVCQAESGDCATEREEPSSGIMDVEYFDKTDVGNNIR